VAETFGNVVVEAFCFGTPCLVSDIGALPELVYPKPLCSLSMQAALPRSDHRMAGEVFNPGDSADLIHKITKMLHNPQRLKEMSDQARQQYLAKYLPEQNQQALLACYHQALKEQGKARSGSRRSE
jgi:glycosyltransferase involved in cell wall biosynthesis